MDRDHVKRIGDRSARRSKWFYLRTKMGIHTALRTTMSVALISSLLSCTGAETPVNFAGTQCGLQLASAADSQLAPPASEAEAASSLVPSNSISNSSSNTVSSESGIYDLETYLNAQQQNTNADLHIVGGNEAFRGEFPFVVSLVYSGRHFCGGSLVHEQFVLTAAHCYISSYFGDVNSPRYLSVRIREYIRSILREGNPLQEDIKVIKAIPHSEWTSSLFKGSMHDIALLKLEKPVVWDRYVQPVCLTPQGLNTDGGSATVIGWGTTTFGGQPSDVLQKADVPVLSNLMCRVMYGFNLLFHPIIDSSHVCAAWQGGTDSCQGDSGGPLFVKLEDKFALLGVVSEGFGCAKFFNPGKYTRVSFYLQWIKDRIKENI